MNTIVNARAASTMATIIDAAAHGVQVTYTVLWIGQKNLV